MRRWLDGRRLDGAVDLRPGMEPTIGVMPGNPFGGTSAHHEGGNAMLEFAEQLRQIIDAADGVRRC